MARSGDIKNSSATAWVLGSGVTALGVLRSLAAAGIKGTCLSPSGDLIKWSRWYTFEPEDSFSRPLERPTAASRDHPVVAIPCSDDWALRLARRPAAPGLLITSSPPDVIARLIDKARFAEVLRDARIEHPETLEIRAQSDLRRVPARVWESAFLKPTDSQSFQQIFGVKGITVSGLHQAAREFDTCAAAGQEMVVQEYVSGPPTNHVFIDGYVGADGAPALLARRRLRMYPRDFGNSTCMISVPLTEVQDAVHAATRLLEHVGYRGFLSIELKYDSRDGRPKVLELNPRAWWYVDFATRCGLNLCHRAVRDALGERLEDSPAYEAGRTCVYPYYDFFAARALVQEGQLTRLAWVRSWLTAVQPLFRLTDPLPALVGSAKVVSQKARKALRPKPREREAEKKGRAAAPALIASGESAG